MDNIEKNWLEENAAVVGGVILLILFIIIIILLIVIYKSIFKQKEKKKNRRCTGILPYTVGHGDIRRKSLYPTGVVFSPDLPPIDEEEASDTSIETEDEVVEEGSVQEYPKDLVKMWPNDLGKDIEEATASVKAKIQSSRKAKKQRTESETSLCSNHSEDSLSSKNASIKQTYPVCISKRFFNEIPKGNKQRKCNKSTPNQMQTRRLSRMGKNNERYAGKIYSKEQFAIDPKRSKKAIGIDTKGRDQRKQVAVPVRNIRKTALQYPMYNPHNLGLMAYRV